MGHITRCPSCATLFKVVQDQLRISEGWVRCGQCKEVFDAVAHLQVLLPDMPGDRLHVPLPTGPADAAQAMHPEEGSHVAAATVGAGAMADPACGVQPAAVPGTARALLSPSPVAGAEQEGAPGPWAGHPPIAPPVQADTAAFLVGPPRGATIEGAAMPAPPDRDGETSGQARGANAAVFAMAQGAAAGSGETNTVTDAPAEPGEVLPSAGPPEPQRGGYELPTAPVSDAEPDWVEEYADLPPGFAVPLQPGVSLPEADSSHPGRAQAALPQDALAQDGTASDYANTAESMLQQDTLPRSPSQPLPAPDTETAPEPSFVRAARRHAFWRRPPVRLALLAGAALLASALLAQIALQQRNFLAAAQPAWRPVLGALCAPLQCSIGAYRDIAAVAIDSSSFNKARGNSYQLALTLTNRSGLAVELPAVELTLTDTNDQPVVRRVLAPKDLHAPATLQKRGEWSGTVQVQLALADSARIAGYRVLAFYP